MCVDERILRFSSNFYENLYSLYSQISKIDFPEFFCCVVDLGLKRRQLLALTSLRPTQCLPEYERLLFVVVEILKVS